MILSLLNQWGRLCSSQSLNNHILKNSMRQKKLLFIGDSLIEFFDWQSRFPEYQITDLGIAGETTQGLLYRAESVIKRIAPPDLILIMIGTNNVTMEDFVFLPTYEEVIDTFSKAFPDATLVVNSLLPMHLPWLAGNTIERINTKLVELSITKEIKFLDTYKHFFDTRKNPCVKYFLEDGVHLSEKGYAAWASTIENFLKDEIS